MRSWRKSALSIALVVATLAACSDRGSESAPTNVSDPKSERTSFVRSTELINGTEVVSLRALPSPLDPGFAWDLVPRRTFTLGPEDAPAVYDPRALLDLGSVIVVSDPYSDSPLKLLDPATGELRVEFGRKGQGPGELGDRLVFMRNGPDSFAVLDTNNRQVHRFTATGVQQESLPYQPPFTVASGYPMLGVGGLMVSYPDGVGSLAAFDSLGGYVATLAPLPEMPSTIEPGVITRGRPLVAALPGSAVTMFSGDPLVRVYELDGDEREIRLPLSSRRLTNEDIDLAREEVGDYLASSLRPGPIALTNDIQPLGDTVFGLFLNDMWRAAGDPRLPAREVYWRLFTVAGEYLGTLRQPDGFRILGVGDGVVWARTLNDIGQPTISEFELHRVE